MSKVAKNWWFVFSGATLLLVGVISFGIYASFSFRNGTKLWNDGFQAASAGDFDGAISKYTAALGSWLGNYNRAIIHSNRGVAYNNKGLFDNAISDFTEALRRDPRCAVAYIGRSFAYQTKGESEKALHDVNEAIRLDPNSRDAYANRGWILAAKRQFDQAISDFSEAIRCDPGNPDLYTKRGETYLAKGDLRAAIASFDSAIRIAPKNPAAYADRAIAYERENKWYEALTDYDTAYRLTPDRTQAQPMLDGAWARKNAFEKNKNELESYVVEKRALDLLNQGIKAAKEGRLDQAIQFYRDALQLKPSVRNTAVIFCDRANAYARLKQLEKSARDYDEALRLDPNFVEAYYNRGINDRELGQLDKAIDDFSEALRLNPKYVRAYVDRAGVHVRKNNFAKAKNDYAAAINMIEELEPELRHEILNNVAWMYATSSNRFLRDGKQAVAAATKACDITRWKDPAPLDTLAAAYAEMGDFHNAAKFQTQSLKLCTEADDRRERMEERLALYHKHKPFHQEPKSKAR